MQNLSGENIHGLDVSHWQGNIDWKAVKEHNNIKFAYLKATEGRTYNDPSFIFNAKEARSAGIPVGAYHFARPDNNPTKENAIEEAKFFIATLERGFGHRNYGDIYPVLDLEVPSACKDAKLNTLQVLEWANSFKNFFNKQIESGLMIYTGSYFIQEHNNFNYLTSGNPLADMPLWIAMYPNARGKKNYPQNVGNWKRWTVWQYTNSGKINGIAGKVDLNWAVPELINPSRQK